MIELFMLYSLFPTYTVRLNELIGYETSIVILQSSITGSVNLPIRESEQFPCARKSVMIFMSVLYSRNGCSLMRLIATFELSLIMVPLILVYAGR